MNKKLVTLFILTIACFCYPVYALESNQSKDDITNQTLQLDNNNQVSILSGLHQADGKTYYYNSDGSLHYGFKVIDGKTYYFSLIDGRMLHGFIQVNGIGPWYYLDETGVMATGLQTINETKYLFNNLGHMQTGFQVLNGNKYFFSRVDGKMRTGIFWIDGPSYYFDSNGIMQTGLHQVDGKTYYFNSDGTMQTGFKELEGKTYYFSLMDGRMLHGFIQINGIGPWYYLDETGVMATGLQTINGTKYLFNDKGQMQTGFQILNGNKYFFSRVDGKMRTGIFWIDGPSYYFDSNGIMQTGLQQVDGKTYYFNSDGTMQTGFKEFEGKIYYFSLMDGRMLYGFIQINGIGPWYYLDENGALVTGIKEIEGEKYFFNNKGQMQLGFQVINNKTYYFSLWSGRMLHGFIQINGIGPWYYLDNDGVMLTGLQQILNKKYYFNSNGTMHMGFKTINGKTYFFSRMDGHMKDGWQYIDGHQYYFNENCEMLTGNQTIDGVKYYFYSDGKLRPGFIEKNGKTYYIDAAGNYMNDWTVIEGIKYFFNSLGELIAKDAKFIIDVSTWQDIIDWDKVKAEGKVDGVILRIGYSTNGLDSQFVRNLSEVKRLGIPYGVYLYSYAENATEAIMEADWMISLLKKYDVNATLGIYYDVEHSEYAEKMGPLAKQIHDQFIPAFINKLKQAGYSNASVYTYLNYADKYMGDIAKQYVTWIAQYNHSCQYDGNYNMWQYAGGDWGEYVSGINGRVDSNVWSNNFVK